MISPRLLASLDRKAEKHLLDMVTGIGQGLDLLPPKVQDQAFSADLSSLRDLDPVFWSRGSSTRSSSPGAGFRLLTAARMTATFPLITPAVYLPTRPAVRVVDSGFRDNYGVELAADWIFQNREWLKANTSGVVLIQIRCSPATRRTVDDARPTPRTTGWGGATSSS